MDSQAAAGDAGSFDVQSTDGTTIKVWVQGEGPPIVLVHGSLRDHTIFEPLIAHLQSSMTTYAIDRRGFGASGDREDTPSSKSSETSRSSSTPSRRARGPWPSVVTPTVRVAPWAQRR